MMNRDTRIQVPSGDATIHEIWEFALTYNAYDRHGGFKPVAHVANGCASDWSRSRVVPDDLSTLRQALFFEQRRARHTETGPSNNVPEYIRALVQKISVLSDGSVEGPSDPLP